MPQNPKSHSISFLEGDGPLLVIQPLVGIGDMVWHKKWIDSLIADQHVILATKMASHPHILFADSLASDQILPIERNSRGIKGRHDGLFGLLRLARDFKATGAKRALVLHHSQSYIRALRLAGIKAIAAYGFGKVRGVSSACLAAEDKALHATEKMAKFWRLNGWQAPDNDWHIGVSEDNHFAARAYLDEMGISPDKLIILGIGAMHEDRCWPAMRFAQLVMQLRLERPEMAIALMGGPAERPIAKAIQSEITKAGNAPALEVFRPLDEAIAILSQAKGYVGNDTSLLNIAAVLGIPSLGLFSQSAPLTYVPTLHHLDVIADEDYGQPSVILQIEVDDVLAGIEAVWPPDNKTL
ncbi:MAG: glycosyltransferase family 9 protein [Candidatus Puniceispirillaceae bacterium]